MSFLLVLPVSERSELIYRESRWYSIVKPFCISLDCGQRTKYFESGTVSLPGIRFDRLSHMLCGVSVLYYDGDMRLSPPDLLSFFEFQYAANILISAVSSMIIYKLSWFPSNYAINRVVLVSYMKVL